MGMSGGVGYEKQKFYTSLGMSKWFIGRLNRLVRADQPFRFVHKGEFPQKQPRLGTIYALPEFEIKQAVTTNEYVPVDQDKEVMIMRWKSSKREGKSKDYNEIDLIYNPADEDFMVFSEDAGCGSSWPTLVQALEEFEVCMNLPIPLRLDRLYELVDKESYTVGSRDSPDASDALSVQSRAELYKETESFGKWS